jgi:hypothetical protein
MGPDEGSGAERGSPCHGVVQGLYTFDPYLVCADFESYWECHSPRGPGGHMRSARYPRRLIFFATLSSGTRAFA